MDIQQILLAALGGLLVASGVGLLVGAARSKVAKPSQRTRSVVLGMILFVGGLFTLFIAFPQRHMPLALPATTLGAAVIGVVAGYLYGHASGRSA